MLYRIGTVEELQKVSLPEVVHREILRCTEILDKEYGPSRDYLESGGYTFFAESKEDVEKIREIIDFERHPCEWADWLFSLEQLYVSALFLMNDDFSIVVIMPLEATPLVIQKELEAEK